MRGSVIFQEAWINIQSGAAKAGWLSVALILAIGLTSIAELWTVSALDSRAREYHAAGASIRILKTESSVDPQRCDALVKTSGIQTAGALKTADPIGISSLPGVTTPAFATTLGFQTVLGLDTALNQGVLISEPLAQRWKVRAGDTLETDQGPIDVAAIFPYPEDDGRDSRLTNAVLIPSLGEGLFDECWADVWPSTASFDPLLRASQGAGTVEAATTVSILNPTLGLVFTGAEEYQNRLTRYAPVTSAALGLTIGFMGGARRRLEYASSLHAGVASQDLTLIALVESALWSGSAGTLGTAGILLGARYGEPMVAGSLMGHLLTIGALGALGAITGSLLPATLSRENRLFKYFKERN